MENGKRIIHPYETSPEGTIINAVNTLSDYPVHFYYSNECARNEIPYSNCIYIAPKYTQNYTNRAITISRSEFKNVCNSGFKEGKVRETPKFIIDEETVDGDNNNGENVVNNGENWVSNGEIEGIITEYDDKNFNYLNPLILNIVNFKYLNDDNIITNLLKFDQAHKLGDKYCFTYIIYVHKACSY